MADWSREGCISTWFVPIGAALAAIAARSWLRLSLLMPMNRVLPATCTSFSPSTWTSTGTASPGQCASSRGTRSVPILSWLSSIGAMTRAALQFATQTLVVRNSSSRRTPADFSARPSAVSLFPLGLLAAAPWGAGATMSCPHRFERQAGRSSRICRRRHDTAPVREPADHDLDPDAATIRPLVVSDSLAAACDGGAIDSLAGRVGLR